MDPTAGIALGALVFAVSVYVIHRACLWLESRGLILCHGHPSPCADGGLAALRPAAEPGASPIVEIAPRKVAVDLSGAGSERTRLGPFEPLRMQALHRPDCAV